MSQQNNGGLPTQKISGEPARDAAINKRIETNEKHLSLIGGRKRKTKKIYTRGGGNDISNPSPISPPIVPNTGSSSETRGAQQGSYNELAKLSGNVIEQSRYDKVGGRIKKRKSKKYNRARRTKSRKLKKIKKIKKSKKSKRKRR